MTVLVLFAVLALTVAGCVCVLWAKRGGPRWVRLVAAGTLGVASVVTHVAGALASSSRKSRSSSGSADGGE
ncbi:hypothetical protein [Streptomyces sp. NBC_01304]|uniref:hypothetical protein n=1 Tax=Streptomyces sp. NBC_01304 TaxID=2903818 RepID=UPI002E107B91|nr:hypothetical protein OG430_43640 [Streptomyces sp. NBC_01304]